MNGKNRLGTTLMIVCMLITKQLVGQATFQFTIQSWGTYTTYDSYDWNADTTAMELKETTTQLGAGIRRARLRGKMTKGKAKAFLQFDIASGHMMDAQIEYSLMENTKLILGRFIGAGSQAGGRTSHTAIDFAERSIVGRLWASAVGRSDYRTYGLSLLGKFSILDYQITANNGDGSLNLKPYNTKSSNSDTDTGPIPQLDFMVSTKLDNGISMGLHYGLPNEDRINVSSITGFFYRKPDDYKKGKLRGKFDFARVVNHESQPNDIYLGWSINGFYRLSEKMEIGTGYETWDYNVDKDKDAIGNFIVGINYSPNPEKWKDTLFKLIFTFKNSEIDNEPFDPMIIHLVWQVYMH